MTDGSFFWRVDTADYVEHYQVALPSEFLRHGSSLKWEPAPLSPVEVDLADDEVASFYQSAADEALWPSDL